MCVGHLQKHQKLGLPPPRFSCTFTDSNLPVCCREQFPPLHPVACSVGKDQCMRPSIRDKQGKASSESPLRCALLTHTWRLQLGPTSQPYRPLRTVTVTDGHWLGHRSHELILTLGSFFRRRRWPQCGVRDCWATPRCRRWKYWSSGKIWECDGQGHCWDPAPVRVSTILYTSTRGPDESHGIPN